MRTVNIDAPPKGPIRWRWVTSAFASLLRAAGIISPDESVNIDSTTGGFTLSQNNQPTVVRTDIKNLYGNTYQIPDLFVVIELQSFDIPSTVVSVPNGYFVCIKIENNLPFDVTNIPSSEVSIAVIPISALSLARCDIPDAIGIIYIPLAVNDNGFTPLAQGESFGVFLYSGFRFIDY
jgi:hypothetical protein